MVEAGSLTRPRQYDSLIDPTSLREPYLAFTRKAVSLFRARRPDSGEMKLTTLLNGSVLSTLNSLRSVSLSYSMRPSIRFPVLPSLPLLRSVHLSYSMLLRHPASDTGLDFLVTSCHFPCHPDHFGTF